MDKGEVVCGNCNGTGIDKNDICFKCFGSKKIDWVENITGKEALLFKYKLNYIKSTFDNIINYTSKCKYDLIYWEINQILSGMKDTSLINNFVVTEKGSGSFTVLLKFKEEHQPIRLIFHNKNVRKYF